MRWNDIWISRQGIRNPNDHILPTMRRLPFFVICIFMALPAPAQETSQTARLFAPGEISTGAYELNAVFSPDGSELYYTISTPDPGFDLMTIVVSQRTAQGWSEPEVASFSGRYSDVDPYFSPDGSRMFFISKRPHPDSTSTEPKRDFDIWYVDREGSGWSEAQRLEGPVTTDGDEYFPALTADGTMYFSGRREEGKRDFDLYRSRLVDGAYTEPERLGDAVNSESHEIDVYVDPQERYLIYVSYREGQGRGDLYVSYNRGGEWTPAENLGDAVNTSAREYCPMVSPDGRTLYFTSDRSVVDVARDERLTYAELQQMIDSPGNGLGDIYSISLDAVGVHGETPSGSN